MKILRLLPSFMATMMLIVGACFMVNGQDTTARKSVGGNMQGDDAFISKSIRDNQMEIEMSQMAIDKSDNQKIKALAQQMVNDHSKMLADLKKVQGTAGQGDHDMSTMSDSAAMSKPGDTGTASNQLDMAGRKTSKDADTATNDTTARDTAMAAMTGQPNERDAVGDHHAALMNATGKEFNDLWVSQMLDAHNAKLDELQNASASLSNAELKGIVQQAIPKVKMHRDRLQELSKTSGGKTKSKSKSAGADSKKGTSTEKQSEGTGTGAGTNPR